MLIYCIWRKRQTVHRHRLRLLLKQKRFWHPQGLLLKRQRMYKQAIKHLQGELEVQPRSSKILEQLKSSLEGLHLIDRYLEMFPSDTLLSDHFWQERLMADDADCTSTNLCSGFWNKLLDTASHTLLGAPEDEDFTEEMHILSLYDDCPPAAPLSFSLPQQITPHMLKLQPMQASHEEDSNADLDQITMEEYNNPLYDESLTAAVSCTKKTVSFSPVDEIFEGIDQYSTSASNDSIVSFKQRSAELCPSSTEFVLAEITEDNAS